MRRVVLMDGGMGQELIARSVHPLHPLWSAYVMDLQPEIVVEVHRDFIEAGAKVITVNGYTLTGPRLTRAGIGDRFAELQEAACRLALEARGDAGDVRIAGCLPPLVGSYRPDLAPPYEAAVAEYRRIVEVQAPHVDLFIAETMPSGIEARAAAKAALESGKPVWISWTLQDGGARRLRSKETLAEAEAALRGVAVSARLVNCCHPESVAAALPELLALGGPVGAYPNGFVTVDPLQPGGTVAGLSAREDMSPEVFADWGLRWAEAGATILGGCCEIGPTHIAALCQRLKRRGYEIVAAPG